MSLYKSEHEDLNLHVSICAERYQGIQEKFQNVDIRFQILENKVTEIQQVISDGQRSLKTTLITSAGTIVAGLIGLITTILMKF